jgi:hypothetical protein
MGSDDSSQTLAAVFDIIPSMGASFSIDCRLDDDVADHVVGNLLRN